MTFSPLLEEYLATPIRQRTPEQRAAAYVESYDQLVDWWQAFYDRNRATPIMRSDTIEINVPVHIERMIEKRNSFVFGYELVRDALEYTLSSGDKVDRVWTAANDEQADGRFKR